MLGTWYKAPLMLAVPQVQSWPRGKDAHSFLGVQNRRELFSLLSFNLQQKERLPQSNYLLPPGLCLDGSSLCSRLAFQTLTYVKSSHKAKDEKSEGRARAAQGTRGEIGGRLLGKQGRAGVQK